MPKGRLRSSAKTKRSVVLPEFLRSRRTMMRPARESARKTSPLGASASQRGYSSPPSAQVLISNPGGRLSLALAGLGTTRGGLVELEVAFGGGSCEGLISWCPSVLPFSACALGRECREEAIAKATSSAAGS